MSADALCAACGSPAPADAEQCPTCSADPRLRGRYRLLSVVGHGAVGTTYRALDGETGEVVAVRVDEEGQWRAETLATADAALTAISAYQGRVFASTSSGVARPPGP